MKKFEIKSSAAAPKTFAVPGATKKSGKNDPVDAFINAMEDAAEDIEATAPLYDGMFRAYDQAIRDVTDTEFTLVPYMPISANGEIVEVTLHPTIVFQSRALKEEFLARLSERFPGEILGDKYISGDLLARALGFELTAHRPNLKGEWKPAERLTKLVR